MPGYGPFCDDQAELLKFSVDLGGSPAKDMLNSAYSALGRSAHLRGTAEARHRDRRDQREQIHGARHRRPPSQDWITFLDSHVKSMVSVSSPTTSSFLRRSYASDRTSLRPHENPVAPSRLRDQQANPPQALPIHSQMPAQTKSAMGRPRSEWIHLAEAGGIRRSATRSLVEEVPCERRARTMAWK